jgi:hypothetical protein
VKQYSSSFTHHAKAQLYARDDPASGPLPPIPHQPLVQQAAAGLDEDWLREDEQSYFAEAPVPTAESDSDRDYAKTKEERAEKERQSSVQALVWWLAEGGIIPNKWTAPSKDALAKMGSEGFQDMLEDLDRGDSGEGIFQDGWGDYAAKQYRTVVFSKVSCCGCMYANSAPADGQTYCPYSKKAKKILAGYSLTPAPFIIELDQRCELRCTRIKAQADVVQPTCLICRHSCKASRVDGPCPIS